MYVKVPSPDSASGSIFDIRTKSDELDSEEKSPQTSPRSISTKSLRHSLKTPTKTSYSLAKFGNGRNANLDHNILDVKVSRKLKDLGTRTRRLNSITMMRQNFNNMRQQRRERANSVQLSSRNNERNKLISEGRTRLNSLTGEDGLTRRAEKLSSITSDDDRADLVEAGRQRLNSLTSEDRQRMTYQGSLLGLKNRTIGSGPRGGRTSPVAKQSLAS